MSADFTWQKKKKNVKIVFNINLFKTYIENKMQRRL